MPLFLVITVLTLNVAGFRRSHVFLIFSDLAPLVNRRRLLPRKHWSAGVADSYHGNIALLALVLSDSKVQHCGETDPRYHPMIPHSGCWATVGYCYSFTDLNSDCGCAKPNCPFLDGGWIHTHQLSFFSLAACDEFSTLTVTHIDEVIDLK